MASDKLKLNPDNTKFMWFTSRGRQHLIDHSSIVGHGINIKPSSTVRLLGVHVDEAMSFEAHRKCSENVLLSVAATQGYSELYTIRHSTNTGKYVCDHEVRLL